MKYRVKKRREITYPDGSPRGGQGYIIDGSKWYERATVEAFGDALEPAERQSVVTEADLEKLAKPQAAPKPAKKAAKKKAARKAPRKPSAASKAPDGVAEGEAAPEAPDGPLGASDGKGGEE